MKIASVLTPLTDHNLTLAAQAGVEEVVIRYPGPDLSLIDDVFERVASFGLRIGVIEGRLPIDAIKLGRDDGTEMHQWKALVRHLGAIGIPIVCYNFMAGTDWIRTSVDALERRLEIPDDLAQLEGHFDGFPVVAGVVQLAWALDAMADWLGRRPALGEPSRQVGQRHIGNQRESRQCGYSLGAMEVALVM